jgi:hypothetical protein
MSATISYSLLNRQTSNEKKRTEEEEEEMSLAAV